MILTYGNRILSFGGRILDYTTPMAQTMNSVAFVDATYGNNATGQVGNPDLPFSTIQAAITAVPAGGVLMIGLGEYAKPTSINKEVTFVGSGMPSYNWTVTQSSLTAVTRTDPTALVGGTVIKGGLGFVDKNNIRVFNLGIDNGSAYVAGGGAEDNALAVYRSVDDEVNNGPNPPYTLYKGVRMDNLILLCKDPNSLYHGLVLQGAYDVQITNITIWGGVHGLATKVIGGYYQNITTYKNGANGIIVKANPYALATPIRIDGFSISDSPIGVRFENKAATTMRNVTVTNGFISNCTTGVTTLNTSGSGFDAASMVVHNVTMTGVTTAFANASNYRYWGTTGGTFLQNYITSSEYSFSTLTFPTTDGTVQNAGGVWSSNANDGDYGHKALAALKLASGTPGGIIQYYTSSGGAGAYYGFNNANALTALSAMKVAFSINAAGLVVVNNGSGVLSNITPVANTFYGIFRTGSTFVLRSSTDGNTWTTIYTFTHTGSGDYWPVLDVYGDNTLYNLNQPRHTGLQ